MAKINANYEAMYILDPSLNEEAVAALVAKFKAVVEANGTVSEVDEWGKRRLAYPINDLMAVSYTHLDVYKRQATASRSSSFIVPTCSCSRRSGAAIA